MRFSRFALPVIMFFIIAVSMVRAKNPVIVDQNAADPEILFSEKTGLFYIYPTSLADGFRAYSSSNLIHWKEEERVLKLQDVRWENKNPWAPAILEKKMDGKYRYFFYFCAGEKIGVATGDDPLGPFVDSGAPLIDSIPDGVERGVPIDPNVFNDPVSGKTFLYWGNSFLAVCELNDDLISLHRETMKVMTPPNYFEGPYVFYRNGIYYLTWSEHDTRSVDYQVRYLIADTPTGPFHLPEGVTDNLILTKRPDDEIFGTGHHSVLRLPGTDSWRIVYHRLCLPLGKNPWARETCIDRLEFNPDGSIRPITPTHEGIGL